MMGGDMGFGMKLGMQNNFHFGARYDDYLTDYHLKPAQDNSIIKPYSLDAVIGLSIGNDIASFSLLYTRSITNRYNQNFVQHINGVEIYPLKDKKFDRNLISLGLTIYISRIINH